MSINPSMQNANNINVDWKSNLDDWDSGDSDLREVVVQKADIGSKYTYALQLVKGHTFVYRGNNASNVSFNKYNPVLDLAGTAGGHTQTFAYAGQPGTGNWFVGTKLNNLNNYRNWSKWSKQIARVSIPQYGTISSNTEMPRLSNLNYAGSNYDYNVSCTGNQLARVEAAVSPDYTYFMIAYGDNSDNGYFALYNLSDINDALDNVSDSNGYVDITNVNCLKAFEIPHLATDNVVGSLQGFAISEDGNYIYISSQPSSDKYGYDRKIVKIPWGTTDPSDWEVVNLNNASKMFVNGYYTEIEGIQLINDNDLYLTVAYHNYNTDDTRINKIFEISWTSNI
ncbi:helveticin J family class III bacteriocin [Lactobacillus acetotolerans]|uniref:helveticin J family class III bacteriocin n=1 Tax=Lactobacillus acetotolerans TaxID=1600 RepID=UPI0009EE05F8|nr:helveticin J family class III bacteriocin [Lactobacillus acetotolerans]